MKDFSGKIHLIVGSMFSGKTTELFRLCTREIIASKKVLMIKYAGDNRYNEAKITSHDRFEMNAISTYILYDIQEEALKYDCIGIDEGQFFPDIVSFADMLANKGILVYIAALDSDFKREPFPSIGALLAIAERAYKLTAVCIKCGKTAAFSFRESSNMELELIGGADLYKALCRICFFEKSYKKITNL